MRAIQRQGFTLVEILVVLAIISIFAALTFAVFTRVREKGRAAVCQNNLRQIAIATQQYVQDHDGRYPAFDMMSQRYISPLLRVRCPDGPFEGGQMNTTYDYNEDQLTYWVMTRMIRQDKNGWEAEGNTFGKLESRLKDPANTIMYSEGVEVPSWLEARRASYMGGEDVGCEFGTWHSGGSNYVFVDGHVKWLTPKSGCDFLQRRVK